MRNLGFLMMAVTSSFLPGCILLTGNIYEPVPDPLEKQFTKATAVSGRTISLADGRQVQLAGIDLDSLDAKQRSAFVAELSKWTVGREKVLVLNEKDNVAEVAVSGGNLCPWREFPVIILFPKIVKCPPVRQDVARELIIAGFAKVRETEIPDPERRKLLIDSQKHATEYHLGVWRTTAELLCDAAGEGDLAAVRSLVKAGANVNAGGYPMSKQTLPLVEAARHGREEVVRYLLDNKADIRARDGHNTSALDAAAAMGHHKTASLLIAAGADVNDSYSVPFANAAANGHIEVVRVMLQAGARLDYPGAESVLLGPANEGRLDLIKLLVDHGAKVDSPDREGKRPLWMAAWNGHVEVVKYLLSKGADVNARDNSSYTPLKLARQNNHAAVVTILEKAGARE